MTVNTQLDIREQLHGAKTFSFQIEHHRAYRDAHCDCLATLAQPRVTA